MIDYVKIVLKNIDVNRLLSLNKLDFKIVVSESTGEISSKKEATYHFCKITIYNSGLILFTGSIHKMYNSIKGIKAPNYNEVKQYKGFNGNQFTINNVLEVREYLQKLFNCKAKQMIFQNIEFGINTTPVFNPQLFIKGLLYHNGKQFEYRFNQHFAQVIHQRYILKIYNKSSQYNISNYTLRVELKIMKIEDVKHLGLKSFATINNRLLEQVKQLILKRFDEVVVYDCTINKKELTKLQKQALIKYSNPRYWCNELKPNLRYRHKKKLLYFIKKYSNNLKQQVRNNIIKKCSTINRLSKEPKCSIINHSSKGLNIRHLVS